MTVPQAQWGFGLSGWWPDEFAENKGFSDVLKGSKGFTTQTLSWSILSEVGPDKRRCVGVCGVLMG